ncbi:nucleotidyltransferase domain-containing protein [Haemophilus paraphrohaemolyticus]|uniref:nucleotidyltransferase domain-containing protein n=1 Tax=Haemophilus paraphrohaemolyticus TaxID=736 RepID=UPI00298E9EE5|nr:nucleotidyltransferase domain-containing protein [Haemophilus paraphrohaemolyticus]
MDIIAILYCVFCNIGFRHKGLNECSTQAILDVFAQYPEIEQVIIYGSRVKGNYREGFDIDFTLKGQALNQEKLYRIQDALGAAHTPIYLMCQFTISFQIPL